MLKMVLICLSIGALTGCTYFSEDPVPHNRVSFENRTLDTVTFSFEQSERFSKQEMASGVSLRLRNHSFMNLETDFILTVDQFDDGWEEIDTIDFFEKSFNYTLEREEELNHKIFSDQFAEDLENGRYRVSLEYTLTSDEGEEAHTHSIGSVFWIED